MKDICVSKYKAREWLPLDLPLCLGNALIKAICLPPSDAAWGVLEGINDCCPFDSPSNLLAAQCVVKPFLARCCPACSSRVRCLSLQDSSSSMRRWLPYLEATAAQPALNKSQATCLLSTVAPGTPVSLVLSQARYTSLGLYRVFWLPKASQATSLVRIARMHHAFEPSMTLA